MTRQIDGVEFHVESPSCLYLAAAPVMIAFNGEVWVVACHDKRGEIIHRTFNSRADAIALIREAWTQ